MIAGRRECGAPFFMCRDLHMTAAPIWYFAYGSNMNPARLADDRLSPRGVAVEQRLLAALPDWRLAFNKPWAKFNGAGAANILPPAGQIGTAPGRESGGQYGWISGVADS